MITSLDPNAAMFPSKGVLKVSLAHFNYTGDLLFKFHHHNIAPFWAMTQILDPDSVFGMVEYRLIPGGTAALRILDREDGLLELVLHTEDNDDCTVELDLDNYPDALASMVVGMEVIEFEKA